MAAQPVGPSEDADVAQSFHVAIMPVDMKPTPSRRPAIESYRRP